MDKLENLNRLNDVFFKSLLGTIDRKNLTLNFINSILGKDEHSYFVDMEFINTELLPPVEGVKVPELDILARLNDGTYVNIEVQVTKQKFYTKRSLYYWSRLYGYQLKRGRHYRKLVQTIAINLLDFDHLPYSEYHNCYHITNDRNHDRLTDDLEIHYIELRKFKFSDYKKLKRADSWIAYFSPECTNKEREEIAMNNPAIKEALNHEMAFTKDDQQWYEYEQREKAIKDYNAIIEDNREEALKEGIQKNKIDNAARLLKLGIGVEIVSQGTGLSLEQVQQLQKHIQD